MTKPAAWYRRQIAGFMLIAEDSGLMSKEYIIEKLSLVMDEQGINFHPTIADYLDKVCDFPNCKEGFHEEIN
jgi:hypothetical protein